MIEILYKNSEHEFIDVEWECFSFPSGEYQVKLLNTEGLKSGDYYFNIVGSVVNENFIKLALLKSALGHIAMGRGLLINSYLMVPYLPYSRQDRVCSVGEAFSLKVIGNLINAMQFDRVYTWDAHSDVSNMCIRNLLNKTPNNLYGKFVKELHDNGDIDTLVAPDAGSTPKINAMSYAYNIPVLQGHKKRDPETGSLTGFGYNGVASFKNLLIVDDICDGGGTFIGLTKELLAGGASSVSLLVTHGFFSKGVDILLDNGISNIYTTNSLVGGIRPEIIKVGGI